MHCLDKYINDIEPRIRAIYKSIPTQEEPSLQSSLAAYGWILLDSWIAWRTLRYLLRNALIDDQVQDKWVQTPSSYSASQLRAAWNWDRSVIDFLESKTSKKFKALIDETIQKKRNTSAHYNMKSDISGIDAQEIKLLYDVFSKVFVSCELDSFINDVANKLHLQGYRLHSVFVGEIDTNMDGIHSKLDEFAKDKKITLIFSGESGASYKLRFDVDGVFALVLLDDSTCWKNVVNAQVARYSLLENKGFCLDVDLFCKTVMECWQS